MKRTDIINELIRRNNYKSYLEIGVGNGMSYQSIYCENKESCDPYNDEDDGSCLDVITYNMTSDDMFYYMDPNKKYDIIFIDGLHSGNQVLKDLWNSLQHITENGMILIHDSFPPVESLCRYPRTNETSWWGSVYKIYPILLSEGIDFSILCDDCGIGIIKGNQRFRSINVPQESDWNFFDIYASDFDYSREFKMMWAYQYFGI